MTATIRVGVIPAVEHGTGFVAVAVRFPAAPVAHRVTRLFHRPDGTQGGIPARFDGTEQCRTEIRPACRPDSDPGERLYELSVPTALARGATACGHDDCFGGAA
ncbi:hypothetical protein [Couchioplanes caeruleus]|uniref:Uncharacterized protein n=2 Tax=Couchioplanes caeruleus TaxID=56438 RepID=A0A1K0FRR0_9ACTN|nr:hypothetical protein [Couchioplanes caeruleus]OJF15525.1 hypothetical protein BG844_04065 [Couchioplanes caeruleus subsp. caeruleus]ROP30935.1 hypothetical protein EDD30_3820 [Couchioplanes caeruleus]